MKTACMQLCSADDVTSNFARVERLLQQAAELGVQLAALPENFAFMHPDFKAKQKFVLNESSKVLVFLAESAKKFSLAIIGGSLLLPGREGKLRNACPVYSREGECLGIYDKIHLFDVDLPDGRYHESNQIEAGDMPLTVQIEDWLLGVSICYDLRFPELYREYAARGCTLLSIPSAFTVPTGKAHWEILLRARAIENQAYVLAPAQIGTHPGGRQTYGHSMIIDPWGRIIARAANKAGISDELIMADIDAVLVGEIRQKVPVLEHRKI